MSTEHAVARAVLDRCTQLLQRYPVIEPLLRGLDEPPVKPVNATAAPLQQCVGPGEART